MKKTLLLFVSVMTVILLVLLCTSCGDKDPAPRDTSAPVSSAPSDTSGISSNGDDTRSAPETGKAPSASKLFDYLQLRCLVVMIRVWGGNLPP